MIDANTKDLAVRGVYPIAYRLKDGYLVRSTVGEIPRVEEDYELLTSQATQRYVLIGMSREGEIGRLYANFESHVSEFLHLSRCETLRQLVVDQQRSPRTIQFDYAISSNAFMISS